MPLAPMVRLCDIAETYQGIILDLFGTIHDGARPLEGAIDALHRLRSKGIVVCLLSNSPRRSEEVAMRLAEMGFTQDLYAGLVTSGELVFEALTSRAERLHGDLGNYFHMGPAELSHLLSGSGRTLTRSIKNARFVLATGMVETAEELECTLGQALSRGLEMVCANPDRTVLLGDTLIDCAGTLACRYQQLGGTVVYHGKPYRPAYEHALRLLGVPSRMVLAIGDSLETDIAGANNLGIDAALVLSGLHKEVLRQGSPAWGRLQQLCRASGAYPKFVLPAFSWIWKSVGPASGLPA